MDVTKVVIENWLKANYLSIYIPIIIAIIALCISAYSIYTTRKIFVESHRPYVWASNYEDPEHEKSTIMGIGQPFSFSAACHVKNSPARIIRAELKINLNMETLFVHTEKNAVKFPDEMSLWEFDINMEDHEKIMSRSNEDKFKLVRLISLEYSTLDGGRIYHYNLEQSYIPILHQWGNTNEKTD
jgi:divalent metal cation (Fe/Co/Zn/Cd) transporter